MTKDYCSKFTYTDMSPCIFRKSRVKKVREMPGGKTEVTYDNGRKMLLRAEVAEVRMEIYGEEDEQYDG